MALKDVEKKKYYKLGELYSVVGNDFFGFCDKKFYKAIKEGLNGVKCNYFRGDDKLNSPTKLVNHAYHIRGSDFLKFYEEVEKALDGMYSNDKGLSS